MRNFTLPLQKVFYVFLFLCWVNSGKSQAPLNISDFAVWGGSASSGFYNSSQGVTVGNSAIIQGNLGSNHLITVKNSFTLTGSIFSGNAVILGNSVKITGDIFAAKNATNSPANSIYGDNRSNFIGNVTAKGKIVLQTGVGPLASTISGRVAVPAPTSTNYSGPTPAGGIVNTVVLPVLPLMPNNTSFDSQLGTTDITTTQTLSPGKYRKLSLTGTKTITFNGPGNYIFNEVDNGISANKFVFDFKNTTTGTINIFIIKDAKWGKLSVNTINGNFPSRIYTEIHGTGSTNGGFAFDLQSPGVVTSGTYSWLGNVWVPNGGIAVKSFISSTSPQIIGALWSGTKVDLSDNLVLSYQAPGSQAPPSPTLNLNSFAVWGGSASSGSYNSSQGVTVGNSAIIQGNLGSNHLITVKNSFTLTGSIFSGNAVILGNSVKITGDIFAAKNATNSPANSIYGDNRSNFIGNVTAKGKIVLQTGVGPLASTISGRVAVPAPTSTNYSGPTPAGGIVNTVVLPVLPLMPNNTSFDSQLGTTDITTTQTLSPGKYRKLSLTGTKTITFNGPGNYIFNEVDNGISANKFVFDFKNTTTGTINIFIIKDAKWGKLSVNTINGNFPSRIYTEIHGTGSTNGGFAFDLQSPGVVTSGTYSWLGNVWVPNGGIAVKSFISSTSPQIIGALWSGTKVDLADNLVLSYQAPVGGPTYVDPYYPPPANGKVNTANNTIGAELLSLSQNTAPITSIPENEIFILDNAGKVMIEVVSKTANDNTLKGQLVTLGMTGIIDNGPQVFVITGFFPINLLSQLNSNSRIQYVRPLYPPISNAGQVTTQGDITMRSKAVRERFGLDGSGVKIGVISDSYNSKLTAQNDVDQGDLPGIKTNGQPNENPEPVQVLADTKGSDEGRAMLQIVHDVAPKSKLVFRTGFLSAGDFAKGIQELASPSLPGGRCDIIVDDITYVTEPFFRDGTAARAVDQVVAQGVNYFSAAGNFGNKSYEAVFNGVTNTSIIPIGQIHKFGSTTADIYQTVNLKPGSYTIVLQWSDDFYSLGNTAGVQTDMDLYLLDGNGFTLFGFNRSNLLGDPFEVCPFTVRQETNAKVMVVRAAGTGNVRFKYIIFRGEANILDYQTGTSSLVGQANANGAIAVGAMLYANIPSITPVWPGVASFSSRGGTSTLQNNIFVTRNKPELIGPNGVNTTVNLGSAPFDDGDPYPNFFGTSAAAPHVAAVGALLIQGRKKFNLQTTVTPGEIRQQLQSTAGKFSYLGGFSFEGGYGYVQADSAIQQIANAKPIIDSLKAVIPGAQNGSQPFTIKVKGKYLTSNTKIYANGVAISNTIVSADKTEATATVPAIISGQNPSFQLFNPAKSQSNLDGGLSEPLFFFGSRVAVTIRAVNKSRKYGLSNPGFTAEILINGVPVSSQTNITLAALKLDNLTFTTIATPTSDAGLYGIFPSRTVALANDDPLLSQYGFTFESGTLTVEKMPLKITPGNLQIKYGEYPANITYNYVLDPSASGSSTLLEEVKALHKKYLADNGLVVVNGFNNQSPVITQSDLANMSTMASFQSVRNARKFNLVNGQLQALVNSIDPSQIGDQRFIVDVSAQSLANYKSDPANSAMFQSLPGSHARGLLNVKALTNGTAKASVPNGQLQPMVNGQLLAMVNGQLQALVNGQLQALVNGFYVTAADIVFQNGQLLALVNGTWIAITNGQLQALVNGQTVTVQLSVTNGQLQALVNGQLMALVNGQLQAIVNGQLLVIVNGQLQALVNGQLMPMVNGLLMAMVDGTLMPMVNGQLLALVNGQLMALVNGELQIVQDLILSNGQLQALVNGQLLALVNGQLKAMVNGFVTDVPTTSFNLVNGQLQAIVNSQPVAMVNGQLLAIVNGQLQPLVNGAAVAVQNVRQLANGQLQALVNGTTSTYIPITSGQLQAIVNGQLLAMVNGQLMAIVNGELTFTVFKNGQLQALVNGQLQALVNGQLLAMVNGQLQALVNSATPADNSYNIANGQLQAIVNGQTWAYTNGQLLALVNGQLQALVNNFDVSGTNNNAKTLVLVDEDDINLQSGDVGGMFSMNMITGLSAGIQTLIPGGFVNENFEVTYGSGQVTILPAPLIVKAKDTTKVYGNANPVFTTSYSGFAYSDGVGNITSPTVSCAANNTSPVNTYPITLSGGSSANYTLVLQNGNLSITKKDLTVTATSLAKVYGEANPPLGYTASGFVNGDDITGIDVPPFVSTPVNTASGAGTYPINLIGGSDNNYNLVLQPGVFTVTKAVLSAAADNKSRVYGSPNPALTFSYSGFLLGDNAGAIATAPVATTSANSGSPAGNYPINLSGGVAANYSFSYTPGILTITQAPLTATADDKSKAYGVANPVFTISYSGFVNGDIASAVTTAPVASTTATTNSVAGTYPITLAAGSSANYFISYVSGTLTIIGKPTLTVTVQNKTKNQGEPNPTLTLDFDGFINGDNENTICPGSPAPTYIAPPSPVTITQLGRATTYTNVLLTSPSVVNNIPNVITVAPEVPVTLSASRSTIVGDGAGCLGCNTQNYVGVTDIFSEYFNGNGGSGVISRTFKAPKVPGIYYITQTAGWQCDYFHGGNGNPDNNPANAIAVVIVDGADLYATTGATTYSGIGNYPITLSGCIDNPKYNVVYTPGTLTVDEDPCIERHWDGNQTYTDRINNVPGTAVGGVSNFGIGKFGATTRTVPNTCNAGTMEANNSFSFDGTGTGYIDAGTAGSVAGTGDFSVSAWVQTTSSNPMVIINQRGSDNGNYPSGFDGEYILKIGGNHAEGVQNSNAGKAYFLIYDFANNLSGVELFSTTLVNDGNWHHIKGERIGININLYVDGALEASGNTAGVVILNTAIPTYIGADVRNSASYFNGLIDDIRVSICPATSARQANNAAAIATSNALPPVTESVVKSVKNTESKPAEDKLYPNPASSIIRVQLKDDIRQIKDIRVYDGVGKLIATSSRRINDGLYEINVANLSGGIYIIEAKTTAGIKTFKFIKI